MKWYIDKIQKTNPAMLHYNEAWLRNPAMMHYNEAWLRDWIDNVVTEQEDVEAAGRLDDAIKDAEDRYGVEIDYMSKLQLLSVIAKMLEVLGA